MPVYESRQLEQLAWQPFAQEAEQDANPQVGDGSRYSSSVEKW